MMVPTKKNNTTPLAFCPYLMPGYPDEQTFVAAADALVDTGATLIEMQIPFCDPAADGAVLSRIHGEVIQAGMTTERALGMIAMIKQRHPDVEICVMSYLNSVLHYGPAEFVAYLEQHSIDYLLVPDLPYQEYGLIPYTDRVRSVRLVSDNLRDDEIATISSQTTGFVYVLSTIATTGGSLDHAMVGDCLAHVRAIVGDDQRLIVGFGIRTAADVAFLRTTSVDGFIIASQLMREIDQGGVAQLRDYVASLAL